MSQRAQAEQATVYRAANGRRYLTKRGALYASARHLVNQGCECESGDYATGYPGYVCTMHYMGEDGCQQPRADVLIQRLFRWLRHMERMPHA